MSVINSTVAPTKTNETGDVVVTFTTPSNKIGILNPYFQMKDASGRTFGKRIYARYFVAGVSPVTSLANQRRLTGKDVTRLILVDEDSVAINNMLLQSFKDSHRYLKWTDEELTQYYYAHNINYREVSLAEARATAPLYATLLLVGQSARSMQVTTTLGTATGILAAAANSTLPMIQLIAPSVIFAAGNGVVYAYISSEAYANRISAYGTEPPANSQAKVLIPNFNSVRAVSLPRLSNGVPHGGPIPKNWQHEHVGESSFYIYSYCRGDKNSDDYSFGIGTDFGHFFMTGLKCIDAPSNAHQLEDLIMKLLKDKNITTKNFPKFMETINTFLDTIHIWFP